MKRTSHIAAAALIGFCGLAIAGPDGTADEKQVLRGPDVRQSTDNGQSFDRKQRNAKKAGEQNSQRAAARPGMELRSMIAAMRTLKKAEGDLALTEEQDEQIRAIVKEQRQAMKAFMEEHREELEALRPEGANRRGGGQQGDPMIDGMDPMEEMMGDEPERRRGERGDKGEDGDRGNRAARGDRGQRPDPEARKAAAEKIKAIMKDAPADGEARKAIMGVLTEGQREMVTKTMKEQRERVENRRANARDARGERGERGAQAGKDADGEKRAPRQKQGKRKAPEDNDG